MTTRPRHCKICYMILDIKIIAFLKLSNLQKRCFILSPKISTAICPFPFVKCFERDFERPLPVCCTTQPAGPENFGARIQKAKKAGHTKTDFCATELPPSALTLESRATLLVRVLTFGQSFRCLANFWGPKLKSF